MPVCLSVILFVFAIIPVDSSVSKIKPSFGLIKSKFL